MTRLSYAERQAAEIALLDWMKKRGSEIDRLGGNSKMMIETLEPAIASVASANTAQEKMKAALKDQTKLVGSTDRHAYVLASSYFDVVAGLYGKGSSEATQLRRIRSKMRQPPKASPDVPSLARQ